MFNEIKQKLEDDYSLSCAGWSDHYLMEKIYDYLNEELIGLLGKDDEKVISGICELLGEELLDI